MYYKLIQISKEEYEKWEVIIVDKGRYFWVYRKDLEVEADVANRARSFDKCDLEKQKYRQELTPNAEYQQCRVFVQNDLVERKIKSCRKSSKESHGIIIIIRTNPDAADFDMNRLINQIYMQIIKSTKKQTKYQLKNH